MKKLQGAISPISNIFKSAVFLLAVVVLLFGATLAVQEISAESTVAEQLVNTSATAENQFGSVDQSAIVFSDYDQLVDAGDFGVIQPGNGEEYFQPVDDHWFCSDDFIVPVLADPQIHEQTETGGKGGQQVPPNKDLYKVSF